MPAHTQSRWKIALALVARGTRAELYADAGSVFACLMPGGSGISRNATPRDYVRRARSRPHVSPVARRA